MKNKQFYKKLISHVFYYTGVVFILNKIFRKKQIKFLMYHKVKMKNFEQQMKYLVNNYEVINPLLAIERIKSETVSGKEVVITFDDGFKNTYVNAYPVLKKLRIPATLFLTTSYIGASKLSWWDSVKFFLDSCTISQLESINRLNKKVFDSHNLMQYKRSSEKFINLLKNCDNKTREQIVDSISYTIDTKLPRLDDDYLFMNWEEVYELRDVFNFGAHTHTHPILTKCSLPEVRNEIIKSKKIIKEKLGISSRGFCYPNGNFNKKIASIVKNLGFDYACTANNGALGAKDDFFAIKRIGINVDDQLQDFILKLSPAWLVIK